MEKREIIMSLKQLKTEKKLTLDQIKDMLEENGIPIAKSTLGRIFADGSEDKDFRYDTLRPVFETLLDIDHIEKTDSPDIQAMKRLLRLKRDLIGELRDEITSTNEQVEQAIAKVKVKYHEKMEADLAKYQKTIDFATHQIALKDQRIDALLADIDKLLDNNNALMATNNRLVYQLMNCPYAKEIREKG